MSAPRQYWQPASPMFRTPPPLVAASRLSTVSRAAPPVTKQEPIQLSELPEEEGLPLLGATLDIYGSGFNLGPLFEKHGSRFMLNSGPLAGKVLALNDAQDIIEAQAQYPTLTLSMPDSFARVVSNDGPERSPAEARAWRQSLFRVLSQSAVFQFQMPLFMPMMENTIHRLANQSEPVLWWNEVNRIAFNVSARAMLGNLLDDEDLDRMFPRFRTFAAASFALSFGLRDGIPGTPYHKGVLARIECEDFLRQHLLKQLATGALPPRTTLAEALEGLREEGMAIADLPTEELAAALAKEACGMMFAGTDTSTHTLSKAASFLSQHPEWLDRMWEEQQEVVAVHGSRIDGKVMQASPVAAAVAHEVMRCAHTNIMQMRHANEDTVVAGMAVPAGTRIWLYIRQAAESHGGEAFDPSTWLSPAATKHAESADQSTAEQAGKCPMRQFAKSKVPAVANMVFGSGPRRCLGQQLIITELTALCILLGRSVKRIDMEKHEQERGFPPMFDHPTGMPATLIPR